MKLLYTILLATTASLYTISPLEIQQFAQPLACPSSLVKPIQVKKPLKYLHISFHAGCIVEIEQVAQKCGIDLTSWFILGQPLEDFEGLNADLYVYNITAARAERVWQKHKDYFNQFDVIITSDTAPLSRIFLQNDHWKKPLLIWVCNRFDYFFSPTHKPLDFPDQDYYDLFKRATTQKNVHIISYTAYEWYHALKQGINIGLKTIKPIGATEPHERYESSTWSVPAHINKQETIFIYPRLDEQQLKYIQQACDQYALPTYCGTYNGTRDIADFKAIMYWPYQWSNLCLFEDFQLGLVHFVPSKKFVQELAQTGAPISSVMHAMVKDDSFQFNEWYTQEHAPLIVYYDSWQDLKEKIETTDYATMRATIKEFAQKHTTETIQAWKNTFKTIELQYQDCRN